MKILDIILNIMLVLFGILILMLLINLIIFFGFGIVKTIKLVLS